MALDPKQNQRRIYIQMRLPQARDELKATADAVSQLRGRSKPLIKTAESQDAGRRLIFCRERMKEVRGEIQRLKQERTAILSMGK